MVDDKGNLTGTSELVDDKDDNVIDNIDIPLGNLISHDDGDTQALIAEQKSDTTLQPCWQLAKQQKAGVVVENGILYRNDGVCWHTIKQLCVPDWRRVAVMQLANDANHLAGKKTTAYNVFFLFAGYEETNLPILWIMQTMSVTCYGEKNRSSPYFAHCKTVPTI